MTQITAKARAQHAGEPPPPTGAPRLLLVDDAPEIRELARATLEMDGWSVLTVADGAAALAALARERDFGAVVLDVVMPGMDGPAVLRELRAAGLPEPVPVVFLTAGTRRADHRSLLSLGAAGVIVKPFDPGALPRMLELMLEEARAEPERRPPIRTGHPRAARAAVQGAS
jgi:DNA-binding response OmpR family regulator